VACRNHDLAGNAQSSIQEASRFSIQQAGDDFSAKFIAMSGAGQSFSQIDIFLISLPVPKRELQFVTPGRQSLVELTDFP
jgi:hypothetical protein